MREGEREGWRDRGGGLWGKEMEGRNETARGGERVLGGGGRCCCMY